MSTKAKLQQTNDYRLFIQSNENREVITESAHFRKMLKSMRQYGFLPSYPMHVRSKGNRFEIVDGQHRFEAARELKLPVFFVVYDNGELDIAQINNVQKAWNAANYVDSFASQGLSDYIELREFTRRHVFPISVSIAVLRGQAAHVQSATMKALKQGAFKVRARETADLFASIILAVREVSRVAFHSTFLIAVSRCLSVKEFDAEVFIHKCRTFRGMLVSQADLDAFTAMIERIYNHQSRKPIPLAFLVSAEMKRRACREPNKAKCS